MGRAPETATGLACPSQVWTTGDTRAGDISHGPSSPVPLTAGEARPIYRPRHPERTGFYRIFGRHFEAYVGTHEERFEHRSGPLKPAVTRVVEACLDCGRQRSPRPVVHRHLVFTIPRALRGLFARARRLLGLLSHCAYEAVRRAYGAYLEDRTVVPGFVALIQMLGSFAANFHPHIHALVTQGALQREGEFLPVGTVNTDVIEELFRRLVLTRLGRAERLSEEFRDNLLGWVHSGFSVHAGPRIYPTDAEHLERLGRTIVRVPMPSKDVGLDLRGESARCHASGSEKWEDGADAQSPGLDPRGGAADPCASATPGPVLRRLCEPETQGDAERGDFRKALTSSASWTATSIRLVQLGIRSSEPRSDPTIS